MSVITNVLEVFTEIGEWLPTAITSMIPIFWVPETGLSFVGVLACAGLAIAVCLLVFNTIRSFLRFQ